VPKLKKFVFLSLLISFFLFNSKASKFFSIKAQTTKFYGPIMIGVDYYNTLPNPTNQGPFIPWGLALQEGSNYDSQVQKLSKLDPSMTKMIALASWQVLKNKLSGIGTAYDASYLHDIGVEWVAYNTETLSDGPGTPTEELNNVFSLETNPNQPDVNSVVQFARIAEENGFKSTWAPYRGTYGRIISGRPSAGEVFADEARKEAFALMVANGLDAVWLQEQRAVMNSCIEDRVIEFNKTRSGYQEIINDYSHITGGRMVEMMIQLKPDVDSGCLEADAYNFNPANHCQLSATGQQYRFQACDEFVDQLGTGLYSIGIWAMREDPNDTDELIDVLRAGGGVPPATPTPTPPPSSISLSQGWNEIVWATVTGIRASDIPPGCPIAVAQESFWFRPYIKNYGGVNFEFKTGKTYYLKCNQEVVWDL